MNRIQSSTKDNDIISWNRRDVEQWLGFRGGRFTKVNSLLTLLIGLLLTVIVYAFLGLLFAETMIGQMFLNRGFTPYAMTLLFCWSLSIAFIKWRKLTFQRQTVYIHVVPAELDFVLSVTTVDQVLQNIVLAVDDAKKFVLFNRVFTALSNLRNLGNISDVDEMLRSQADLDESTMETSYAIVRGFIWAIPVLGFIGTVMGLSVAIGGFGDVLSKTSDPTALAESLKVVTGGLSTAFETTLLALLFALFLQLMVTFLHKSEEEFLDECSEYCQKNVVAKLRIMPFEQGVH
ncbi:MotA/TolQ/ExbB proton channel family protein [Mariniblastus sp.]|nr:MotA/TolQ/ExbB proton channel family protein [Mariniblastus sp.]